MPSGPYTPPPPPTSSHLVSGLASEVESSVGCRALLVLDALLLSIHHPSPLSLWPLCLPQPATPFCFIRGPYVGFGSGQCLPFEALPKPSLTSHMLFPKKEVLSRAPCCQSNHFLRIQNINVSLPCICFLVRFFPAVTSSDHRGKKKNKHHDLLCVALVDVEQENAGDPPGADIPDPTRAPPAHPLAGSLCPET